MTTLRTTLAACIALALPSSVSAQASAAIASGATKPSALAPGEIVAAAPAADWVAIAPSDLLIMTLAPDRDGKQRQVVIQLMPPPFSQGWIANIRKLVAARFWDGLSINRVQDNYVVQWGDASEQRPLPAGLTTVPESGYRVIAPPDIRKQFEAVANREDAALAAAMQIPAGPARVRAIRQGIARDPYSTETINYRSWPLARDSESYWPVHCYGMVGVGRDLSPDTGSGAELYTVIGHAPRHLDRNIALVGRVIEGIEHLSSLPRGTLALGFYEKPEQRVPIRSMRVASELPSAEQPKFEYLSTESESFAKYADARANRRDPFFNVPAGGADICNIPVPVRRIAAR